MRSRSTTALVGAALFGIGLSATGLQAQNPKLLYDVNQTGQLTSSFPSSARSSTNVGGNYAHQMLVVGPFAYFTARNPKTGTELYRTTGTPKSVTLIKDINPGASSSSPFYLHPVKIGTKTMIFFRANDGKNGTELFVTDGTAGGTKMVKDIRAGSLSSFPVLGGAFQGKLWFYANDGTNGSELWVSDGTSAGTKMFKDLWPGSGSSFPRYFTEFNGKLYFSANDGTNGYELWQSDGTVKGTIMLANLRTGASSSSPSGFVVVGKKLFFRAFGNSGSELYVTDGTATGTVLVKDIRPGTSSSSPYYFTPYKGKLIFYANNGTNGWELWQSDGTSAGTTMIKDIYAGASSSSPRYFTEISGLLYFVAFDATNGTELWKTDGTATGTVLAANIRSGSSSSSPFYLTKTAKNMLLFRATGDTKGTELYKYDPVAKKASLVKDINATTATASSFLGSLTALPTGFNIMGANDGKTGTELWVSDATTAGTKLLEDISPPGGITNSCFGSYMEPVFGKLFFQGNDGKNGGELWTSDGTSAGTKMVKDLMPGANGSFPSYITRLGNKVIFRARASGFND